MLGGHLLAASATTQNVVATSSGEAEFHAWAKSASRALGAVAMAVVMAKVVKPRVCVDATASKAIASRRGVERGRHLHTQVLWLQEAVARRELTITKVPGVENPADMETKHLAQEEMHDEQGAINWRAVKNDVSGRKGTQAALRATEMETKTRTETETKMVTETSQEHCDGLTTG